MLAYLPNRCGLRPPARNGSRAPPRVESLLGSATPGSRVPHGAVAARGGHRLAVPHLRHRRPGRRPHANGCHRGAGRRPRPHLPPHTGHALAHADGRAGVRPHEGQPAPGRARELEQRSVRYAAPGRRPGGRAFRRETILAQPFPSLGAVHVRPRESTPSDLRLGDILETPTRQLSRVRAHQQLPVGAASLRGPRTPLAGAEAPRHASTRRAKLGVLFLSNSSSWL